MRFTLLVIDFFVWCFYLSRGFLNAKIKAELDIIRNRDIIEKKYIELENKKIVSDEEIIKKLPDEIYVPVNVSENSINQMFNSILSRFSNCLLYTSPSPRDRG